MNRGDGKKGVKVRFQGRRPINFGGCHGIRDTEEGRQVRRRQLKERLMCQKKVATDELVETG